MHNPDDEIDLDFSSTIEAGSLTFSRPHGSLNASEGHLATTLIKLYSYFFVAFGRPLSCPFLQVLYNDVAQVNLSSGLGTGVRRESFGFSSHSLGTRKVIGREWAGILFCQCTHALL